MKKKILVIGYGGTIVMVVNEESNTVEPAKNINEILKMLPKLDAIADIKMDVLANKDSSNITHEDWTKIAVYIYEKHDDYDAFIITHGTNTMANTASALSLSLGVGLKKPVILTGSQLPLSVYGNDARFNFENAVKAAIQASNENIAEVMVSFNHKVLRGGRTMKISESSFDAFDSPAFPPLGTITSTGVHFNQFARKADLTKELKLTPYFDNRILSIDVAPGLDPNFLEKILVVGKIKGIIFKGFGAGSIPTEGNYSLLPFIRKATTKYNIPIIITKKFFGGTAFKKINDECAVLALNKGAISGGDLTSVMSEVKLMWILAQGIGVGKEELIYELMTKPYVGEMNLYR